MQRSVGRALVIGGATLGALGLLAKNTSARQAGRRGVHGVLRRVRYVRGAADGAVYRLRGQHPDPRVSDDVLADRVRSTLGPFEKQRDLPRVHLMVEDQTVVLHGEVPTADDLFAVENQVLGISGVRGVESYLHVGLTRGTTRPSTGRAVQSEQPSDAWRALVQAARDGGAAESEAVAAAHAVFEHVRGSHFRG